jgi:hypothetical protein
MKKVSLADRKSSIYRTDQKQIIVEIFLEGRHARRVFFSGWLCKGEIVLPANHVGQGKGFCGWLQPCPVFSWLIRRACDILSGPNCKE